MVYIIYDYVPSTYDIIIVACCVIDWVLVIPVDTTIHVFNMVSPFVKVDEFTNWVPFHRKISPFVIDVILVSVNKLWFKLVLAHFELELYINAWLFTGDEIEQSVSAANVDDPPVETVALTHFELLEFHCDYWLLVKLDIDTSLCFPTDGNVTFNDNLPPDDTINSFVEL